MASALRAVFCLAMFASMPVLAGPRPDSAEVLAFRRHNPCPSSGQTTGLCPGHAVDHVIPTCLGGPDIAYNMQWLALADYREKARAESRLCPATRGSTHS